MINRDDFVKEIEPFNRVVRRRFGRAAVEVARDCGQNGVVNQRGFARTGDARHASQQTDRERDIDPLEVVAARAVHNELALWVGRSAVFRCGDPQGPGEVTSRERSGMPGDFFGGPLGHDLPAMHARSGSEVDDMVTGADRVFIVFDDQYRIAEIAQMAQRLNQSFVIALMQADRGFIEHIHDPGQTRTNLASQSDSLTFAARKGLGWAVEGKVIEAHVHKKAQS